MGHKAAQALLLGAALALGGCATKIYQGPTSGRSAEAQQAAALSVEHALARYDVEPLRGRAVAVEVYGLTERLEGESPEEAYVRALLNEKLLLAGARVVGGRAEAEVLLVATLRTLGVDIIRRDVPLIYHHTTFRGLASLRLSALGLEGDVVTRTLAKQDVASESIFRETYIFYVIGPITTRAVEPVEARE